CFVDGDETPHALIDGLSAQLIGAIDCLRPGTLSELPGRDWQPWDPARNYLVDARGVDDLLAAAAEGAAPLVIKWGYRDVAIQHLFYLWTQRSCDFAAPPGLSNHQNGLSVDVIEPERWHDTLRAHGWEDNLPTDRPHFDYALAEDEGLAALSLFAFQALWNLNHPDEPLPLTGEFDMATEAALSASPIGGFATGLCDAGAPPVEAPPSRGPSVAQAAWRGCDVPVVLIEGLGAQIAAVMQCAAPDAVAPLRLCAEAGCLSLAAPPQPEWLDAATQDALLAVSTRLGRPIALRRGARDPALATFEYGARTNLSCPSSEPAPGNGVHDTGTAVEVLDPDGDIGPALLEAGFVPTENDDEGGYAFAAGVDQRTLAVYAFQVLWNANRADDPVAEHGVLDAATRAAIGRAPLAGFATVPCDGLTPPEPGAGFSCVVGCFNQACPGTYDFCTEQFGECAEVPCENDAQCAGLSVCDDPARASSPVFYCDGGRCRRQR
ncbi:MAG: D-alanyl-D-alanine carboxypeptidase family protein, partial [Myxococcales bacterium]|nr:D-alanyl-D-alanine carboxypeptidase family protein [Myxococcales bacterium]